METHGFQVSPALANDRNFKEYMEEAARVYQEMFAPGAQEQLLTLDQREKKAVELGGRLGRKALQDHLTRDAKAPVSAGRDWAKCPKCGQPGKPVEMDRARRREVVTRVGPVHVSGQKWYCAACRVAFFPSGPTTGTGRRRLQPINS